MGGHKSPQSALSPAAPRSAKKRRRATMDDGEVEANAGSPPARQSKEKTRPPGAPSIRAIPRFFDEAGTEDKNLITWRDGGMEWSKIRELWFNMTGEEVATSTLPNRYERLKSNFVGMMPDDQVRMLESKREIEAAFEDEKWGLIALAVEQKGGGNHSIKNLRREYRKLMESSGVKAPPRGVSAPDFEDPKPSPEPETRNNVNEDDMEEE